MRDLYLRKIPIEALLPAHRLLFYAFTVPSYYVLARTTQVSRGNNGSSSLCEYGWSEGLVGEFLGDPEGWVDKTARLRTESISTA